MSSNKKNKVVYIGGIPFNLTEYDITNIAKTVGTVVAVKLAFDQLTGKSKGYAFVEYADEVAASSAVRNLNNYSVGNRVLKCGYSSANTISGAVTQVTDLSSNSTGNSNGNLNQAGSNSGDSIDPLPKGISIDDNIDVSDYISSTLQSVNNNKLMSILKEAKEMSLRNPSLMSELLNRCPQLEYAIVELLLTFQYKAPENVGDLLSEETKALTTNGDEQQLETKQHELQIQSASEDTQQYQPQQESDAGKNQPSENLTDEEITKLKKFIKFPTEKLDSLTEIQKGAILQIQQNYRNGVYGKQLD